MPQANNFSVIAGALITGTGVSSALNVTAATLVKAARGRVVRVSVLVAGSTGGSVNDAATIAAATAANEVFVVPNTLGAYTVDFPCQNGIVVTPGTGQTLAISYN